MQYIFVTSFSQIITCIFLRWGKSKYLIYKFIVNQLKAKITSLKRSSMKEYWRRCESMKGYERPITIFKIWMEKRHFSCSQRTQSWLHHLFLIFTMWTLQCLCLSLSFVTSWHSFLTCIFCHSFSSSFSCSAAQEIIHFQSSTSYD